MEKTSASIRFFFQFFKCHFDGSNGQLDTRLLWGSVIQKRDYVYSVSVLIYSCMLFDEVAQPLIILILLFEHANGEH